MRLLTLTLLAGLLAGAVQAQSVDALNTAVDAQQKPTGIPNKPLWRDQRVVATGGTYTSITIPTDAKLGVYWALTSSSTPPYYSCSGSCTVPRPTGNVSNGTAWGGPVKTEFYRDSAGKPTTPKVVYFESPANNVTFGAAFYK